MYASICISQSGISSWNTNTSLRKNRPGCCLLSSPFRPVLNTQTSMLMGSPPGPATFVPSVRGCLSLGTGWQPPDCQRPDNQQVARYWSHFLLRYASRLPGPDCSLTGKRLAFVLVPFCCVLLGDRKVKVCRGCRAAGGLHASTKTWKTRVGGVWGRFFCLRTNTWHPMA